MASSYIKSSDGMDVDFGFKTAVKNIGSNFGYVSDNMADKINNYTD